MEAQKMIVAETTNVDTGGGKVIVIKLQKQFLNRKLEKRQFIICHHHVFDRLLSVAMDDKHGSNKTTPNFEYL